MNKKCGTLTHDYTFVVENPCSLNYQIRADHMRKYVHKRQWIS